MQPTPTEVSASAAVAELSARADWDYFGHYAQNTRIRAILTKLRIQFLDVHELADETGTPIFYTKGRNYNWRARACVMFPDQRWLRFLVRASRPGNAIMTAVDQAGNRIARYRFTDKSVRKRSCDSVEIIVGRQPVKAAIDVLQAREITR